ncbi:TlpA family protein disulfide reductase [Paenibacillus sp. NPDC058071]|uniref:TlpA family protein disulfide reductase n=1 Tax=Paenibacillus sp. NPDC058071 TaxID=3346326 RepID=UPI0036DB99E5
MYTVQLGSLVLNLEIVIYLLSGMAGAAGLWLRARKGREDVSRVSDAVNAAWLWVAVWKFSLVLFDPAGVIRDWRSLLYFSGGAYGMALATAVAVVYIVIRGRRAGVGYPVIAGWLSIMVYGWLGVRFFVQAVIEIPSLDGWLYGAASMLALLFFFLQVNESHQTDFRRLAAKGTLAAAALSAILLIDYSGGARPEEVAAGLQSGIQTGLKEGQLAPDFKLTTLDGKETSLSEWRGKPVFINFWASWCPPCRAEMPHMEKLHVKYGDQAVILSVNMTATEKSSQNVEEFAEKYGLTFPIALDEAGSVMERYRIRSYPTTFVVDADGIVRDRVLGAVDYAWMERKLKQVIE